MPMRGGRTSALPFRPVSMTTVQLDRADVGRQPFDARSSGLCGTDAPKHGDHAFARHRQSRP